VISYLIVLAGFAGVAWAARYLERSWVAPAAVWPVIWLLYSAALLPYLTEPTRYVPALLWILINCAAFSCGALLAGGVPPAERPPVRPGQQRFPHLALIVVVLSAASVAALVSAVQSTGFRLGDLLSLASVARMAAAARALFTFGEAEQGALARVLLALAYTAPLFAGLYFPLARRRREKLLALVPLVSIALIGTVHGSRMGVLFGGAFWVAAYLAGRLLASAGQRHLTTRLFFVGGGIAAILLAGVSTAIQFIRYFTGSQKAAAMVIADPFGFLAAFALWFEEAGVRTSAMTGGFYTFERIGRMLGVDRPAVPAIDVGFTSSNVYTVFRSLIEDFGSAGSVVLVLMIGFLGSLAYRRVVRGRGTWVPALALTYAFLFTSVALSPFSYTGPTIGAVLFVMYSAFVARPHGAFRAALVGLTPRPVADPPDG